MSADMLRRAAALMRERAEAATPGPWEYDDAGRVQDDMAYTLATTPNGLDGDHIASWHPAVALAVADWLDGLVDAMTNPDAPDSGVTTDREERQALAVARAYLGGDA